VQARLVVTAGPDMGHHFMLGEQGGVLGRAEGCLVQLSDPSVSREHCRLEVRGAEYLVVDSHSRNKTYVNDREVREHVLASGDEIRIGATRMTFIPREGGLCVTGGASHMTVEISNQDVLGQPHGEGRAHALLGRLAAFGDALAKAEGPPGIARAACAWAADALATRRAFVVSRGGGRLQVLAAHVDAGESGSLEVARDVLDRAGAGAAVAIERPGGAAAAPIGEHDLLWIDGRDRAFDAAEVRLLACAAHLLRASLQQARARDTLERENRALRDRLPDGGEFVGTSEAARAVQSMCAKVGPSDATVLVTGESGSGKEMVAQALHRASKRVAGPFVCVNCAALAETLLESELFGHEKGAFTGADNRKPGRFELADGGTLFLDELGELSEKCQAKLLRVLEERRVLRVGATKPIPVDVRVVAATNRDLLAMAREGRFREDLYYRLSVIRVDVPPLRERAADIPLLAEHFLARMAGQAARRVRGFADDAMAALTRYPWPGNARELRNAVERAVVMGEGDWVQLGDLPPELAQGGGGGSRAPGPGVSAVARALRDWERDAIVAALGATGGNKAQAAALLEIDRSTLYKKLKDYGLGE
jgi:two-component system response regulator HydG